MISIDNKENCCGCEACAEKCPVHCIRIEADEEGFLYPVIDSKNCINCNLCEEVCPFINIEKRILSPSTYACINKDNEVRILSSSGGVFHCLAKKIIDDEGAVYGAAFDEKFNVKHEAAFNIEDATKFRGSKYVQSRMTGCFKEIEQLLKSNIKVLFSGTQCQVNALKNYLGKDYEDLITIAIVCHGIGSDKVWQKYLFEISSKVESTVKYVRFRDKITGWSNYSIRVGLKNGMEYQNTKEKDSYMRAYTNDLLLRPSCFNCKSKGTNMKADIVIADYWGINGSELYIDNKGVSLVNLYTNKGHKFFDSIKNELYCEKRRYETALLFNPNIEKSTPKQNKRAVFFNYLHEGNSVADSVKYTLESNHQGWRDIYYPVLKRMLENKLDNNGIERFFEKYQYKRIVIYGAGEMGKLLYKHLMNSNIEVVCFSDKNMTKYENGVCGETVVSMDKLDTVDFDCIVITCLMHISEAMQELSLRVNIDKIIPLTSVIYGFNGEK